MTESSAVNFKNLHFEYEFPDTQGFQCNPDKMSCGKCCSMPFNVTFKEINRINNFLKNWLRSAEFNDFVLDHATSLQTHITFNPFFLEAIYDKYRRNVQTFFKPAYFTTKDNTLFVLSYRLSYHRTTGKCIFFNPMSYKCVIHDIRPTECRIYPFNFEYDFRINRKIKVFIVEKCEALTNAKPVDKSSLEEAIREFTATLFEENRILQRLRERTGIPFDLPIEAIEKREIRSIHNRFDQIAKWNDEIHISKQKTTDSKIRDVFLEEQIVTCMNEEAYNSYLSQIQKKKPGTTDWE